MQTQDTTRTERSQPLIEGVGSLSVKNFDDLHLVWSEKGLVQVSFDAFRKTPIAPTRKVPSVYAEPLNAYFEGERVDFADVPLDLRGTTFQLAVWAALMRIPYGTVRSYAATAISAGSPRGMRAVGAANGANPIPVIVPCHRVVEANMRLGGFSSGLERKRKLLTLEGIGVEGDIVFPGQLSLI